MQFGAHPPPPVVYPNGFLPDPRRLYGGPMSGPPLPHPLPNPYYPPWNGMPVPGSAPVAFRPTADGWYIPSNPPMSPPSSHHPGSYSAPLVSSSSTPDKPVPPSDNWVHEFWKGRFAPFPGATSPPSLLRKNTSRGVPITAPRDPPSLSRGPSQSHPPHSSNIIFETSTKQSPLKSKVCSIIFFVSCIRTGPQENDKNFEKESENGTDAELEQPLLLDKYVLVLGLVLSSTKMSFRQKYLFPSIFKTFKINHIR